MNKKEEHMNRSKVLLTAIVAIFALSAHPKAFAQCASGPLFTTLQKSGQGNLVCADFAGPNGVTMQDLSNFTAVTAPTGNSTTSWSTNLQSPSLLAGDKAIVEAADGRTCIYDYLVDLYFDPGPLTAPGNKSIKTVTVCTDSQLRGETLTPATDPTPLTTGDGCEGTTLQAAVDDQDGAQGIDIVFGVGTQPDASEQQLALCSDRPNPAGPIAAAASTGQQVQCVDRCETPIGYPVTVGMDSQDCTDALMGATALPDGRLPIACRRCATSGSTQIDSDPGSLYGMLIHSPPTGPNIPEDTPYCWELSHRIAETDGSIVADPMSTPLYPSQLTFRNENVVPGGE
ncbi:MAG: hypothetical protein R3268_10465, partial [Acidiferrobacterales bacterium]|nr:hypothetical protein [Acidiferrobacterales bacterium]